MAIAFDNSTNFDATPAAQTFSFTHTVNSNTNGILIVAIIMGSSTGQDHKTPSSVTFNSVAMTQVVGATVIQAQNGSVSLWFLLSPPTGTNSVNITVPATADPGNNSNGGAVAASYTGVMQSGQPDSSSTNTATTGTSFTLTTATVADNSWTMALFVSNQVAAVSAGSGTTLRKNSTVVRNDMYGDSNGVITPAGSTTLNASGTSGFWVGGIISIAPFTASTTVPSNLTLLGVG